MPINLRVSKIFSPVIPWTKFHNWCWAILSVQNKPFYFFASFQNLFFIFYFSRFLVEIEKFNRPCRSNPKLKICDIRAYDFKGEFIRVTIFGELMRQYLKTLELEKPILFIDVNVGLEKPRNLNAIISTKIVGHSKWNVHHFVDHQVEKEKKTQYFTLKLHNWIA